MSDPFELHKATERQQRKYVIRSGPYTNFNRKQLAHHTAVGAGLGASAGAAVGSHLGAHMHGRELRDIERGRKEYRELSHFPRSKVAGVGALVLGAGGAAYGGLAGMGLANKKRHARAMAAPNKKVVAKADHDHEKVAAGVGGAAAGTAYQAGGYQMKFVAQRRGAKAPAGVSRSKYEKTIKEHQRAHGAYHGGPPEWLGQRGRVGHTIGLVTGQGPTAHVNAARHWPTKIDGVRVPGARTRRVMGYTHGGKTGIAVGAGTTALGALGAAAAEHHHAKKLVAKSEARAIAGAVYRRPGMFREFRRALSGTTRGEHIVNQASNTSKTVPIKNRWGYPAGHRTVGNYGQDAKDQLRAKIASEARHSPHSTSFKAGAKLGHAAGSVGRHPEYAISVPAAGGGVGLAHHEIKRANDKKKKAATVSKSAFGVDHISKYDRGAITYHQEQAAMHSRKKASGGRQVAGGVLVGGAGVAAHQNAERLAARVADFRHSKEGHLKLAYQKSPEWHRTAQAAYGGARKGGAGLAIAGGGLAVIGAGRWVHHGRQQNKQTRLAQQARRSRNASLAKADRRFAPGANTKPPIYLARHSTGAAELRRLKPKSAPAGAAVRNTLRLTRIGKASNAAEARAIAEQLVRRNEKLRDAARRPVGVGTHGRVVKSAFFEPVEKGAIGEALKTGIEALKGVKNGLGGAIGAEQTGAAAAGKNVGAAARGKLLPVAQAATATKQRTAAVAGAGGLAGGMYLNRKNN